MFEYPPVSFYFRVSFFDEEPNGAQGGVFGATYDTRFQSVAGLSAEIQMESYREGGENRYEHQLPGRTKYADLVLKRGLIKDSALIKWCTDAFEQMIIQPKTLDIDLLNEKGETMLKWKVVHAWPKKWSVSDLNAEKSELAIESLELTYRYYTLTIGSD